MEDQYLSQQALQGELLPGETLLWTGQPSRRVVFHTEDWYLIPFSLVWGGFAIFWEFTANGGFSGDKGAPVFFTLWGIPFVVIGQYLIWGRFFYSAWKKGRMIYGLTPKRVLILDKTWKRSLQATYIDQIPLIEKAIRSDGIGTLRFGYMTAETHSRRNSRYSNWDGLNTGGVPSFVDIENAASVYSTVAYLREQAKASTS